MNADQHAFASFLRDWPQRHDAGAVPGKLPVFLEPYREALEGWFGPWDQLPWEAAEKAHGLARGMDGQPNGVYPSSLRGMAPILASLHGQAGEAERWHLPGLAIQPERKDRFHPMEGSGTTSLKALGQRLEAGLTAAVEQSGSSAELLIRIENLLLQVADRVPTPHGDPAVSMAQTARMAAAMAVCGAVAEDASAPFLLVGGSLSGIQSFLYDIVSKNAAKFLKGRSVYMELLLLSVVHRLLEACGLGSWHEVYASGGSFFLLVPNSESMRQALSMERRHIGDCLYESHGMALFLAMDWQPLSLGSVSNTDGSSLADCWSQLFERLGNIKRRRHADRLINQYESFFEPREMGGDRPRDILTNEEFSEDELMSGATVPFGDGRIRRATEEQRRLATLLRRARYHVMTRLQDGAGSEPVNPGGLDVYHNLLEELPARSGSGSIRFSRLNPDGTHQEDTAIRPMWVGGTGYPMESDRDPTPKTFDQLAGQGSLKRLGVLRMDMDDLGLAFRQGLPQRSRTLAGYAMMSRSLDLFFKARLSALWSGTPSFRSGTYILYSGGDDLFLVGRWDLVFQFSAVIREEFGHWTCNNPALGLSGGMVAVGAKHPIAHAAELAASAEANAKTHFVQVEGNIKAKDSFHLLGLTLRWQEEWPYILRYRSLFLEAFQDGSLPTGLATQLFRVSAPHYYPAFAERPGRESPERWRWMMAYHLKRMEERIHSESGKALLHQMKIDLATDTLFGRPNHHHGLNNLMAIQFAARLARLEARTIAPIPNLPIEAPTDQSTNL